MKAGDTLSEPFQSNVGGPQGDVSAALLFSLFISDLVEHIPKIGPKINGAIVSIILYADDMCLIAQSAEDLQQMLDALEVYCDQNKLEVNVSKTKIMVFHRGRMPVADEAHTFLYKGQVLEVVKSFCYLGFWLTVQLSFTRHLEAIIAKARSRIGLLFARLPLKEIPLHLAIQVFQVYVAPIFHYGLSLWISKVSEAAIQALNSVWTKFLKRYLCVPAWSNNAMVYYITSEQPLTKTLRNRARSQYGGLTFPESLSGMKLSFLDNITLDATPYDPIPLLPTEFWSTRVIERIPINAFYRKKLMHEIFDLGHMNICTDNNFHVRAKDTCICKMCSNTAHAYHAQYCSATY